jgi:Protein of unknown function (DUF2752)
LATTDPGQGESGGPSGSPTSLGLIWGAVALAATLLGPLATRWAPLLPGCLFRELTGLPCPTCGSAHAALALARLDLREAIAFNPLTAIGALVFLLGGAAAAVASLTGRPLREPRLSGAAPRAAALLAVAANWAWLLLNPPPIWGQP